MQLEILLAVMLSLMIHKTSLVRHDILWASYLSLYHLGIIVVKQNTWKNMLRHHAYIVQEMALHRHCRAVGRWQEVHFVREYYNIHTIKKFCIPHRESEERHAILFGRSSYFVHDSPPNPPYNHPQQESHLTTSWQECHPELSTIIDDVADSIKCRGSEGISINQVPASTFVFLLMTYLGLWIICRCNLWNIKTIIFHSPSSICWVIFTHPRRSGWSSRFLCLPKSHIYKNHTMLPYDPSCQRSTLWRICDIAHAC